jgi:hypothetical protein
LQFVVWTSFSVLLPACLTLDKQRFLILLNLDSGFSVQNDRALSFDPKDLENPMGTGANDSEIGHEGTSLQAVSEGGIFLCCLG